MSDAIVEMGFQTRSNTVVRITNYIVDAKVSWLVPKRFPRAGSLEWQP